MKMKMNNLKDKVYELEGLLELQALRPDKKDDLRHLIDGRIKEINAIWAGMSSDVKKEAVAPSAVVVAETDCMVETESEPEASIYSVPVDDADVSLTMESPRVPRPEVSAVSGDAPRAVPALCLNDRFQFMRVIAGGDRAAFDKILKKSPNCLTMTQRAIMCLAIATPTPTIPKSWTSWRSFSNITNNSGWASCI